MLSLLLIICIVGFVLVIIYGDPTDDALHFVVECIFAIVAIPTALGITGAFGSHVNNMYIDDEIAMYQEENEKIESQIEVTVSNYMKYEGETFTDLKGDSTIALVSLYPELKSDELVKTQLETYQKNNNKLKSLKVRKIKDRQNKWLLWFGK